MDGLLVILREKMLIFNFLKVFYLVNISCINNILCVWCWYLIFLVLFKSVRKIVIDEYCKFYFNILIKIMLLI